MWVKSVVVVVVVLLICCRRCCFLKHQFSFIVLCSQSFEGRWCWLLKHHQREARRSRVRFLHSGGRFVSFNDKPRFWSTHARWCRNGLDVLLLS